MCGLCPGRLHSLAGLCDASAPRRFFSMLLHSNAGYPRARAWGLWSLPRDTMATAQTIPTKPFEGQKPGTSGLRKRYVLYSSQCQGL